MSLFLARQSNFRPASSGGSGGALLGLYHGGPTTDDDVQTQFGVYPDITSTYYQPTEQNLNISNETARINKGISPLLTLTSKGTQRIYGVASGNSADLIWLDQYITALNTLSQVNPSIVVRASFDHEWEVKVNQSLITGNSAVPSVYGEALSVFLERCAANAPDVLAGYWYGHADTTKIGQVLTAIRVNPNFISLDPYTTDTASSTQTPAQCWQPKLTWLMGNSDYARLGSPPIGLSEFGKSVIFGDSNIATYYTDLKQALVDNGLEFGVFFNRDSGAYSYQITDNSPGDHPFPLARAAFSASLQA